MDLVIACYTAADTFPDQEKYGLISQLRRAAVSIPAKIAEGKHRQHAKAFLQHLSIASGSLAKLEAHLLIANRLHYISRQEVDKLFQRTTEVSKMINGLRKALIQRGTEEGLRKQETSPLLPPNP